MSAKKAEQAKKARRVRGAKGPRKTKKRKEPIDLARVVAGAPAEGAVPEPADAPPPGEEQAGAASAEAAPVETVQDAEGVETGEAAGPVEGAEIGEAIEGVEGVEAGVSVEVGEAEKREGPAAEVPADPTAVGDPTAATAAADPADAPQLRLRAAVEAVVFAADDPVTPAQVAKALGAKVASVRKEIGAIRERLDATGSGIALDEIAGGFQFMTREEHAPAILKLRKSAESRKLTPAALETLAVVAYKQPVQRQEIEDVRGVGCGPILRSLMERGLVKTAGHAQVLGRPLLYATTRRFLDTFGLASLKDLPKVGELGPR